ncbi:MAG: CDP-glycerol glycerophosphotransferase family protein [Treponema sp.]|nr:CDP-glycerol glycerophosphotransferase family protein [Treponema sp.]
MYLLYIDPGTGSMLFSVLIGLAAASYFLFRTLLIRFKTIFLGKNKALKNKSSFVIYNEANHYWSVFQPILEEFEKRQIDVQYLISSETDPVYKNNYNYVHPVYIGAGNKAFASLNFLEADVCLMTTPAIDVYQLKRSKLCRHYSHILHDTGDATCYKLFGIDWFDSILLSGDYQKNDIRALEKIRSLPEKLLITVGSSYLDYYYNKLKVLPPEENHVFTVLVSPSWGKGALLSVMGDKLLNALKDLGWRIIIRPHPQSKNSETDMLKNLEEKYSSYTWDYNSENIDSLSKADIMISDFSGVIFDYIFLFNKPVIYHNAGFNKDMYDAGDIENEPWKFKAIKKFGIELSEYDLPRIKEIIEKAVSDTSLSEERTNAKETAWQNRGRSGTAVVDALLEIRDNLA